MKLLACHVENFGKLSDFSMQFSDGLNIVDAPNGWGKSTLAVFLKVMFYGLDARKQPGAYDKERNIYKPWQGGVFGGELDFSLDDRSYRISRTFGTSEKADEFHLYDLSTNLECQDYSKNIGVELFDLDSGSFRRSIFIAQNDCMSASTDGISAKLSNLADNTNDINNFESANSQLRSLLNHLSPTRATGSIKRREGEIAQLEHELSSFSATEKGYGKLADQQHEQVVRYEELCHQRRLFTIELQKTSREIVRLEKKSQYETLCRETEQMKEKFESFSEQFPAGLPTEEELDTFAQTAKQIDEMDATIRNMADEPESGRPYAEFEAEFAEGVPDEEEIFAQIGRQKILVTAREELHRLESEVHAMQMVENSRRKEGGTGLQWEDSKAERNPSGRKKKFSFWIPVDVVVWLLTLAAAGLALFLPEIALPPELYIISENMLYVRIGLAAAAGFFLIFAAVFAVLARRRWKAGKQQVQIEDDDISFLVEQHDDPNLPDNKELDHLERQLDSKIDEVSDLEQRIHSFLLRYNRECTPEEYMPALYELAGDRKDYVRQKYRKDLLGQAAETKEDLERLLGELVDAYQLTPGENGELEYEKLRVRAAEYRMVRQSYEELLAKKKQFEEENDVAKVMEEKRHPYSLEELNDAIRTIDEKLEVVRGVIGEYDKQMDLLQEQLTLQDEKMAEYQEKIVRQEEEAHKYEIVDYTQKYLIRAKERFTSRYMEPVSQGFEKYYGMICGKTETDWQLDSNMEYSVRECGEFRQVPQLSVGYQDLIGISMRMALVDAMYQSEKPFLLLDDPFVNLDDAKMECAKKLLNSIAAEYQVMYFTCSRVRQP